MQRDANQNGLQLRTEEELCGEPGVL
jgi:hypothetical protein